MRNYHDLLKKVLTTGEIRTDRTGVGTIAIFGEQLRFDLQAGFPIVTTRKINWNVVTTELAWFLRGDDNIKYLNERGVHIWDSWADANGSLNKIYGWQWVNWGNQIATTYHNLINNPFSRRHLISAWNVVDIPEMALAPCHVFMQFNVRNKKILDLQVYVRSNDLFIGMPYNVAEYALLCHLFAHWTGMRVGELVYTIGDAHIYQNHMDQAELLLTRKPYALPTLKLLDEQWPLTFDPDSAELIGYQHHPTIKAPIAL